jgi:hypothetical protein
MGLNLSRKGYEAMRVLQFLTVVRKPPAAIKSKSIVTAGGIKKPVTGNASGAD